MDKIEIQGYKSIRSLSLALQKINIIIGANGSGKSNFLSFFEFLKNLYNCNLQKYVAEHGGLDKYLFEGRKVTEEIKAHLYFGKNGYSFTLTPGEDNFVFANEGLWYSGNPFSANPIDISSYGAEAKVSVNTVARAEYIREYLQSLEKYHFHDTGVNSPFNKVSNIENDIFRLYDKGSNIAAFLYNIKKTNIVRYQLIVRTIQSVAPYFRDFFLEPNENGDLKLRWNDKYSSVVYGINDMSDGTQRFVALATLFLQPKLPQTLIIDEPELGLHPAAIGKLAAFIKSAAQKGCQVIVATQSADLIGYFQPENIVAVDQIGGESVFERLSSEELEQWMGEYTVADLWQRRIISKGQPNR